MARFPNTGQLLWFTITKSPPPAHGVASGPDLSGLYWLGARYYDPIAGRFISCDPLGHDADPSLYAFANGDPINYFDPDGRSPDSGAFPTDPATMLRTFLGDIEHGNNGWTLWSGGMSFFSPDVWPENDFGDISSASPGAGFRSGGDPRRQIFADLNRARDIAVGVGYVVGGSLPWVGDALDVRDVVAPDSSALDRTLGGVSLGANVITAGVLPNVAPIRRGMNLIGDALRESRAGRGLEVGPYTDIGGHHVHAQSAFRGHPTYDPERGFSISQEFMEAGNWNHQDMTTAQRRLFDELAENGPAPGIENSGLPQPNMETV